MNESPINFSYAFSEPHRICVCIPESSDKTLYDCTKDSLTMLWSDGNTKNNPLGAYKRVRVDWKVKITAQCEDIPMQSDSWSRIDGYIPSLCYITKTDDVQVKLECIATSYGDVIKITASNNSTKAKTIGLEACVLDNTINTKWQDFDCPYSVVNPIFNDASDRIVIMDVNKTTVRPSRREAVNYKWTLKPGQSTQSFLLKPNRKYNDDIQSLMDTNWYVQCEQGLDIWRAIIKKAPTFKLPDPIIEQAYKACLCDIFVMREEQADGRIAGLAGTEMYRSANTGEPCFQSLTLGKYGFYKEAKENIEFVSQFQLSNGSWEDDKQWGKYMWGSSGWKSNSIKQYYLRTKDRAFLEESFERMLMSAKWSKQQRDITKTKNNPDHPNWGLMPRGMGDGGLKDGEDLFGVFYPHNFLHCMGLEIAVWAAKELGRVDAYQQLYDNYMDFKQCILRSLEIGHIKEEDGSVWIGSAAHNTKGSRWSVADVVYPTNILAVDHPLAIGTMAKLQSDISEGGLPKHLGWMQDGLWVAIALDAMAYVNILNDNADISADYLVAALNHGTPLFTWCEERAPESGSSKITGDLQHAWTPICVTQFIRDMLLSDHLFDDEMLHITPAVPRYFYQDQSIIEVIDAPTYWGKISFTIEVKNNLVIFDANLLDFEVERAIKLYIRIPDKDKNITLKSYLGAQCNMLDQSVIFLPNEKNIHAVFMIN